MVLLCGNDNLVVLSQASDLQCGARKLISVVRNKKTVE
jgi:hypothetical protein